MNEFPDDPFLGVQEIRHCKAHSSKLEMSPGCWAQSWAQSMHSINTCWFAASNDTKMKYKGKIKYMKVLIRHTVWLSLRLSWFLLCPGHVGAVLIFMASVSLMCHCFHLLHISPHWPLPFLTHFRLNRILRSNKDENPYSSQRVCRSPSSLISFHCFSTLFTQSWNSVALFSKMLNVTAVALTKLTCDGVTGEKRKIYREAIQNRLDL